MSDSVTCGACGTQFEVDMNEDPESRSPCPNCGSTKRHISLHAKGAVHVTASLSATLTVVP